MDVDSILSYKQQVVIDLDGKSEEELKIIREFLVQKCPDFKLKERMIVFNLIPIPTYSWSPKSGAKDKKKNIIREIRSEYEHKEVRKE